MSSLLERLSLGFNEIVMSEKIHGKVLIDLGCGFGRWGHMIRADVDQGGDQVRMIGCDIFKPYLKTVKRYNPYDDLIACDVRHLPLRDQSVDIAIAFEIVEHLSKREGLKVLADLVKICRERIIVSSPSGWFPQGVVHDNEFEKHLSTWTQKDFEELDFKVHKYGLGTDFEALCKRFNFYQFLHLFTLLKYRGYWGGVMLIAMKRVRAQMNHN